MPLTRAPTAPAIGEGAVVFLLRPLADALAEGDPIHGVILGSAVNQDGASSGMAAPNPAAQAEVITAAARDAGVALSSLSYIEAHGTGTALGDPVEIDGLTRAFALRDDGDRLCRHRIRQGQLWPSRRCGGRPGSRPRAACA